MTIGILRSALVHTHAKWISPSSQFARGGYRRRQPNPKDASGTRLRLHPDPFPVCFHDPLHDGESHTAALLVATAAGHAAEHFEDCRLILDRNAHAIVSNRKHDRGAVVRSADADPSRSRWHEADCVLH